MMTVSVKGWLVPRSWRWRWVILFAASSFIAAGLEQKVPDDRPCLALLNARAACRPAAMKVYTANKTTSPSTATEGQARP